MSSTKSAMEVLSKQWSSIPDWAKLFTLAALPATGFWVARFVDGYRAWLALGPGGLPYNLMGFLINLLMTGILAKRETKSLGVYNRPEKSAGWDKSTSEEKTKARTSFLNGDLPQRSDPESHALHWVAPQREKNEDQYMDPKVKEAYLEAYQNLGDNHIDALEWKTSGLEKQGQALFLKKNFAESTILSKCKREIGHLHESDSSGHVLLSLTDAKDVVVKGWGERHRLTGTAVVPLGYTMLYVPRSVEEIDSFVKIFEAAIEYAKSNGKAM